MPRDVAPFVNQQPAVSPTVMFSGSFCPSSVEINSANLRIAPPCPAAGDGLRPPDLRSSATRNPKRRNRYANRPRRYSGHSNQSQDHEQIIDPHI